MVSISLCSFDGVGFAGRNFFRRARARGGGRGSDMAGLGAELVAEAEETSSKV